MTLIGHRTLAEHCWPSARPLAHTLSLVHRALSWLPRQRLPLLYRALVHHRFIALAGIRLAHGAGHCECSLLGEVRPVHVHGIHMKALWASRVLSLARSVMIGAVRCRRPLRGKGACHRCFLSRRCLSMCCVGCRLWCASGDRYDCFGNRLGVHLEPTLLRCAAWGGPPILARFEPGRLSPGNAPQCLPRGSGSLRCKHHACRFGSGFVAR